MHFLRELAAQLKVIWSNWSQGQRVAILLAVLFSVVSLAGVGYWAMTPQYVVLADHLAPTQTAEYVSALEASGIAYQLNFAGSSISVPHSQHSQARLSVRDFLETDVEAEADISGGLWSDPVLNQQRLLRQQELRLARTIQQMKPVRSATVHITRAESSPFVRDQKPAKASVTLDLKSATSFSGRDAQAIISLVAHSVENLSSENVTVISTDGRLLSSPHGLDGEVSSQLEYRNMLESNLAAKAETLLTPLLGMGRATVRVSAEIDFTETERTQRTIDPDSKAKVKEELHTETFSGEDPVALGPPGTASNVSVPPDRSSRSGRRESEDLTTEYINGETTDLIRELPGKIQRLTVAAVIQLPENANTAAVAGNGLAATSAPGSAVQNEVTIESVESIIRNAIGFDPTRGDEIKVVAATLTIAPTLAKPVGFLPTLTDHLPLIRALSLGLASMVALILGLLTIRRMRPVVIGRSSQNTLSPEMVERLNDLSLQMQENPEAVTAVLANWLQPSPEVETVRRRAA